MAIPIPHYVQLITAATLFSVTGWAQTPESDALRLRSERGEPQGQYDLGHHYADGQGVAQDYGEAHRLWRMAAAQGLTRVERPVEVDRDVRTRRRHGVSR